MKLNEIIKMCSEMLNLDLPDVNSGSDLPDIHIVKILQSCANFVYEELYRDYATSLRKTVVDVVDGFADTSVYRMCKVIALTDGEGNDVKFRYSDGGIYVEADGRYNMCYARLPDVIGLNDEVVMPSPRITERIFIYGIIREYYAALGDWVNAKQWDERYKDALAVACGKTSSMRLPVRGWL